MSRNTFLVTVLHNQWFTISKMNYITNHISEMQEILLPLSSIFGPIEKLEKCLQTFKETSTQFILLASTIDFESVMTHPQPYQGAYHGTQISSRKLYVDFLKTQTGTLKVLLEYLQQCLDQLMFHINMKNFRERDIRRPAPLEFKAKIACLEMWYEMIERLQDEVCKTSSIDPDYFLKEDLYGANIYVRI